MVARKLYRHICPYCDSEYESIRKTKTVCCGSRNCRRKRDDEVCFHTEAYKIKKREYDKKYREENKEQIAKTKERCRQAKYEEYLEKCREYSYRWTRENPDKNSAKSNRYRASKLKAIPKNLSETHLKEIDLFYQIARWYDEPMHVDHIVPLKGKNVCGLHVPWNLQLITAEENLIKSNKLL